MKQTTIAAIATPAGSGGVGIIRLSGPDAVPIVEEIFRSYTGNTVSKLNGFTGTLGDIFDGHEKIDQAIVFRYRAPKSYTGEDVVEISGHGGSWVTARILRLCYAQGALPAEPGEFTKRGFLNGKMDLAQAEAVMGIISAQGDAALSAANRLHQGALSKEIRRIADGIVVQAGHLAAWADFPEEDVEEVAEETLTAALQKSKNAIEKLLATYDYGQILREGVPTVIVGRPNVGKSTLMNQLIGYDRSIVSNIPGTTRDVVSESVRVGELVLNLADTAGIRESEDPIEQIGIRRTKEELEKSRLVLALFDNSEPLGQDDIKLLEEIADKPAIVLVNKSDLPPRLDFSMLKSHARHVLQISAVEPETLSGLEPLIKEILAFTEGEQDQVIIANERQRHNLQQGAQALQEALDALAQNMTLDAVSVCLEDALDALFSLTGQRASEEIITQVFSAFCVGK